MPTEAVPFLVGKGGAYIRRLHNICLGCDVKLYRNTSEILVIADDAKRLEFALKIVERAVHHQEVRYPRAASRIVALWRPIWGYLMQTIPRLSIAAVFRVGPGLFMSVPSWNVWNHMT